MTNAIPLGKLILQLKCRILVNCKFVYKALNEYGLKILDDISLIGHNNYETAELIEPPLTTINVPIQELGFLATEVLFDIINGKQPEKRTILETKLIIRDSCKII